jgi:hypothetical protein
MNRETNSNDQDLPSRNSKIEREAEDSREALDEEPEPDTDPLHEGP